DAAVQAAVDEACYGSGYREFVGVPYDESMLMVTARHPTAETWVAGDRTVACFIHGPDPATPTTGSFRDSGR
ncbi:hypothetical protein B7486_79330, partial [cyanobacterium TDX16]